MAMTQQSTTRGRLNCWPQTSWSQRSRYFEYRESHLTFISSFQFVPVMNHRPMSNMAWQQPLPVYQSAGGLTMHEWRAARAGSHSPISNALPRGQALSRAPSDVQVLCGGGKCQSDRYQIDFKQSDTPTLKNTNAILLLLTAANQNVGEDPQGQRRHEPGRLRFQTPSVHSRSHEGQFGDFHQPNVQGFWNRGRKLE